MQIKTFIAAIICCAAILKPMQAHAEGADDDENRRLQDNISSPDPDGSHNPFKKVMGLFSEDDVHAGLKGKFIDAPRNWSLLPPLDTAPGEKGRKLMLTSGVAIAEIPTLDAHVNSTLARIVASAPMTGLRARAVIMAKGDFDAQSTPDGGIFISHGMLRSFKSDDELAYLLARIIHERAQDCWRA